VQIWRSLADVPAGLGATVVVIGNFDGVHLGHQRVLARARETAASRGLTVVAVTFDPHPMAVLRPEHAPTQLTTVERRAELLAEAGADHVLALPFDRDMASWTPDEFSQRVLVDAVHAAVVVVGANFRFGHKAAGDVALLTRLGRTFGFRVEAAPLVEGMLVAAPHLKVLITSREVLHLYGEHELIVPPLAVPDPARRPLARPSARCRDNRARQCGKWHLRSSDSGRR